MDLSTRRLLAAAGRLISVLVLWAYVGSSAPVPVRLGVVLDLTNAGGTKSFACISMALDDFYLKHPTYATRVEHWSCSSGIRVVTSSRRHTLVSAASKPLVVHVFCAKFCELPLIT